MIKITVDHEKLNRFTAAAKRAASVTGSTVRNSIGNAAGFIARHLHHAELELKRIPHNDRTLAQVAKATTQKPAKRRK